MKQLITAFLTIVSMSALAQPAQTLKLTQLEAAPDSALLDGYVGVTDINGRQRYQNYVEVNVTCLTYTPPATSNEPFYRSKFVTKCSTDSTWYIDWQGRAVLVETAPPPVEGDLVVLSLAGDTLSATNSFGVSRVVLPLGGGGTVTSVAVSAPADVFNISGSPVTTSGAIALTFDNQAANTLLAGPTSGAAASPAFRGLVGTDIPTNALDSTHLKAKSVAFANLAPTAGITINQAPLWNPTLSKFVAKTVLTTETNGSADLSGVLTNPTVVGIQGTSVASTSPTNDQVLQYDSGAGEWQPTTLSISNGQIASSAVDSAKVADGGLSLDDIGPRGASNGQAPVWNGSAWRPKTVASVITGSATLDFPSTGSGICTSLTLTVTGAAVADEVAVGPSSSVAGVGRVFTAWVNTENQVTIQFCNFTGSAVNPASGTYNVTVFK